MAQYNLFINWKIHDLNPYQLMNKKEYRPDVKQRLKGSTFFHRSCTTVVAIATLTSQDGGYFGAKDI